MKNFLLLSILILSVASCPKPPVAAHPTPVVTDTAMCVEADQHLAALCNADPSKNAYCCIVDAKTKKGKTYTQFCIEKQNQGIFLNPKCISQIKDCGEINNCTQSGEIK